MDAQFEYVFDKSVALGARVCDPGGVQRRSLIRGDIDAVGVVAIRADRRIKSRPKEAKAVAALCILIELFAVALATDAHLIPGIHRRGGVRDGDDRVRFVTVTRVARYRSIRPGVLGGGKPVHAIHHAGVLVGVTCPA
jgi:hypothetical protein